MDETQLEMVKQWGVQLQLGLSKHIEGSESSQPNNVQYIIAGLVGLKWQYLFVSLLFLIKHKLKQILKFCHQQMWSSAIMILLELT